MKVKWHVTPETKTFSYQGDEGASAVTLFKNNPRPWSLRVVSPYLRFGNMDTLRKTMPFLEYREEHAEKRSIQAQFKGLQDDVRIGLLNKDYTKVKETRAQQVELTERENMLNAVIYRKRQQSLLFFSKINVSLDGQKNEMYAYYHEKRKDKTPVPSREGIPAEKPDTEE